MQLIELFNHSLIGRSSLPALDYEDDQASACSLSFGELNLRSARMTGLLVRRGLERGDRLALFMPNRVEFVELFIACARLGIVVVPINVLYRTLEVAHILEDARPKAVVCTSGLAGIVPAGFEVWNIGDLASARDACEPFYDRKPLSGDDPAAIVYTSGTTGRSKGAVLTHNNFASNAVNLVSCWGISQADRYLAVLPLFHVHGLGNGLHCWLLSGCRMRLVERFEVGRAADWFRDFEPTLFFGVPTVYIRLLELADHQAREIGRRMRLFVSGSAPLSAAVLEAFREKFGQTILERYGMSETLMTLSNPLLGERRPGTVGFPLPGVSARVCGRDGAEIQDGEVGELQVRGPQVFAGYWRDPEATRASFADGWFRTGDLAEVSADGYFTLRGRNSDLIICGGFNIYPREIEEFLLQQPGVLEVAVCGLPDDRKGEVPVAYLVVEGEVDSGRLEEACREGLASFKVPRAFFQVEALPRNAMGKLQKHLLPRDPLQ